MIAPVWQRSVRHWLKRPTVQFIRNRNACGSPNGRDKIDIEHHRIRNLSRARNTGKVDEKRNANRFFQHIAFINQTLARNYSSKITFNVIMPVL